MHGVKRRASSFNTERIDHLYQDPHEQDRRLILHYGDLTDATNLIRIVQQVQPDEFYNLAAQSHVGVSFDTPEYTPIRMRSVFCDCGPEVVVWGTGTPRREFLHDDDLAAACVFLMERYDSDLPINVGWGEDISIAELATLIGEIAEFRGPIRFDASKPTARRASCSTSPESEAWAGVGESRFGAELQ